MVAKSMCVHEVAAAATADALSTVYECSGLKPTSPEAVSMTNAIFMEIVCALEDYQEEVTSA